MKTALALLPLFLLLACNKSEPLRSQALQGEWQITSLEEINRCVSGPDRVCPQWYSAEVQFSTLHTLRFNQTAELNLNCGSYEGELFSADNISFQIKNVRLVQERRCGARGKFESSLIFKYFSESIFLFVDDSVPVVLKNQFKDSLRLQPAI
jgi:hypothetical protein